MADTRKPRAIRRASLPSSLELPYAEQGHEAGAPVVLLHGYADSWRSFEPLLSHLPRSIHAYALTQRGHGDAGKPLSGYRVEDFASDLAAFMDTLGLERAVLVASSSASFAVQRFAIDSPLRVLGLVVIGVPWSLRDKAVGSELSQVVFALNDPVDPAFVRDFVESTVFAPMPPAFLETLISESLMTPARVWKATLQGLLEAVPGAMTGRIGAPTLIVWGDRDAFVSLEDQERLAASIPNSRLVVYEGVGHAVHWEQPERVATDLATFVADLT